MTHKAKVISFGLVNDDQDQEEENRIRQMDPEDFHIPVSDSQGHNTRIQFRCMKQIRAMIAEIIQTKQFPYRSESDLLRHSIVRHLKWLTDQGYLGDNTIFTIEAIIEVARDDENHGQFIASIEKLEERVRYHIREGNNDIADMMLGKVKKLVNQMPNGPWKKKYELELERRFSNGNGNGRG